MSSVGFSLCWCCLDAAAGAASWCCLDAAAGAAWVLLLMLLVGGGDEVCGGLRRLDTTRISSRRIMMSNEDE